MHEATFHDVNTVEKETSKLILKSSAIKSKSVLQFWKQSFKNILGVILRVSKAFILWT